MNFSAATFPVKTHGSYGPKPRFSAKSEVTKPPAQETPPAPTTPTAGRFSKLKTAAYHAVLLIAAMGAGLTGQQIGKQFSSEKPQTMAARATTTGHTETGETKNYHPAQFGRQRLSVVQTYVKDALSDENLTSRMKLGESLKKGTLQKADRREDLTTAMVQYTMPAVVMVDYSIPNPDYDPELRLPPWVPTPPKDFVGMGSGFFLNATGQFATNYHVIENPTKEEPLESISVTLMDGRKLKATLVNADAKADIAVFQLEGEHKNLPFLTLSKTPVKTGDEILVAGHPNDHGWSANFGHISNNNRSLSTGFTGFQTDAAFAPGLSGGPMVNTKGEVIGMNEAMMQSSVGAPIGYTINTETLAKRLPELMKARPKAPPAKEKTETPAK